MLDCEEPQDQANKTARVSGSNAAGNSGTAGNSAACAPESLPGDCIVYVSMVSYCFHPADTSLKQCMQPCSDFCPYCLDPDRHGTRISAQMPHPNSNTLHCASSTAQLFVTSDTFALAAINPSPFRQYGRVICTNWLHSSCRCMTKGTVCG